MHLIDEREKTMDLAIVFLAGALTPVIALTIRAWAMGVEWGD